jgi:hypothetical protein
MVEHPTRHLDTWACIAIIKPQRRIGITFNAIAILKTIGDIGISTCGGDSSTHKVVHSLAILITMQLLDALVVALLMPLLESAARR